MAFLTRKVIPFVFVWCLFCTCHASADDGGYSEERIGRMRAALLYYIAKFVEFPSGPSGAGETSSLTICVIGNDPSVKFLGEVLNGKTAHGKEMRSKFFETVPDSGVAGCQILFLNRSNTPAERALLSAAHAKNVLTVCAVPEVRWGDCMMQIFAEKNRLRVAVDKALVRRFGLQISSELLEVAVLRGDGENNE